MIRTYSLVFKRVEGGDKIKYDTFYLHSKAETNFNQSDIDDCQSILPLYQTYKNLLEKVQAGLLIQS